MRAAKEFFGSVLRVLATIVKRTMAVIFIEVGRALGSGPRADPALDNAERAALQEALNRIVALWEAAPPKRVPAAAGMGEATCRNGLSDPERVGRVSRRHNPP